MEDVKTASDSVDYAECRYGQSRLSFRGPKCGPGDAYIAILGGAETFGRFVAIPFARGLELTIGMRCVNFGASQAGPEAFLAEQDVLQACSAARLTVITVPGAHAIGNAYFSVHKRRNDRILGASPLLRGLYPELDFSQYHFVRHLLRDLHDVSPARFDRVREELQRRWSSLMNQLCGRIGGDIVLLWLGDRTPDDAGEAVIDGDPPFVTRAMLTGLGGRIGTIVEVLDRSDCEEEALVGKLFAEHEREAALRLPGASAHDRAARLLADRIGPLLSGSGWEPDQMAQIA